MSRRKEDSSTLIAGILSDANGRMGKAIEVLKRELSTIRTGRASPSLVENIQVNYYGTPTPLNQLATISVPEARLILVQPWDKGALAGIERSLLSSDIGLNPSNDGNVIRIPIPPLSEDRRRELVRLLGRRIEGGKVAVRNVRRDALDQLRSLERSKQISQDENHNAQEDLQNITDAQIDQIDHLSQAKEAEIMQV